VAFQPPFFFSGMLFSMALYPAAEKMDWFQEDLPGNIAN
jgi:hypothetical protein